MRQPRNRAERRALERATKRLVKVNGKIGLSTRYVVLDAEGNDVTAERVKPRDS